MSVKVNLVQKPLIISTLSAAWLSACQTVPEFESQQAPEPPFSTIEVLGAAPATPLSEKREEGAPLQVVMNVPPQQTSIVKTQPQLGDPIDFICVSPVASEGKLKNRPNTQILWEHFIDLEAIDVFRRIGGKVWDNGKPEAGQAQWNNACAVRVSYMLNHAGHTIEKNGNKTVSGENTKGTPKEWHYYRVRDLSEYLTKSFGGADITIANGNGHKIPAKPGLVCMQDSADPTATNDGSTGHCTLWNGYNTVDGSTIGGYIVKFWNLPCYVPDDRGGELGKLAVVNDEPVFTP